MTKFGFALALCLAFLVGLMMPRLVRGADAQTPAPSTKMMPPSTGWIIHVDAEKHFGAAHPTEVAHHWCKQVAGGMIECQIYDSDNPDARLVAVETILPPAMYKSLPASEQALWHFHKDEIPKVNAKLPDMSATEAKNFLAQMSDTYGKVWLLFDPMSTNNMPTGQPTVVVLK
jgi:hypothetical protein